MVLCDWLLLLSITFSRFIHVAACISISFYCQVMFHCIDILHFVYPLLSSWVVPTILTIMNNAAMNVCV